MNLPSWLSYLESLHPKTIALGLERVEQVRQRLDLKPAFPLIIVGGTNGKGSTCAILEAILHEAGYRVGCYASPHLLEYNERVRVGKQSVSDAELCAAFEKIERARGGISLTYFEFGTLAAMLCFVERGVEVAVLEVGLGGRLDAVNVFDADCAVVTSVDLDHMDYLGDTREVIAFEKVGIFRAGKVAVFGDRDMPEAISSEARRIGAELWRLGNEFDCVTFAPLAEEGFVERAPLTLTSSPEERGGHSLGARQWDFHGKRGTRHALPYPALPGAYQLNNASAALAALDALKNELPVSMNAVRAGLSKVALPGRFQILPGRPQIIFDVAHNPHAAWALAGNLAALPPARTFAVFAMLKDKDIAGVARTLKDCVDVWMVAGIHAPRGASAEEAAGILSGAGIPEAAMQTFSNVACALRSACKRAGETGRIIAFGSFYTVAEAMRASAGVRDGKTDCG